MPKIETIIEVAKVGLGIFVLYFVFDDLDLIAFLKSVFVEWHWGRVVLIGITYALSVTFFDGFKRGLGECWLLVFYGACVLSVLSWATLGTHIEDADPLFGGGETFVDFVPTHYERDQVGAGLFFDLLLPALLGAFVSWRKNVGRPIGGRFGWLADHAAKGILSAVNFVVGLGIWAGILFGCGFATWSMVKLIIDRGELDFYLLWAVPLIVLLSSITLFLGLFLPILVIRDERYRLRAAMRRWRALWKS